MKIEVLFPEICNLYGDLANVRYLKESVDNTEVIETSLKAKPAFVDKKIDLIYMGTTTEDGIKLAVNALKPYVNKLKELIDNGQFILLTGNAQDIFCSHIIIDDKQKIDCLGIINAHANYQMLKRHNSFYIGSLDTMEIVGFKSIFGFCYGNDSDSNGVSNYLSQNFWFKNERGFGTDKTGDFEGFKINNLLSTHLIGPLLPLNPLLTKWLISKINENNGIHSTDIKVAHEEAAMNAYYQRLKEMKNEHFDPNY